MEDKPTQKGWLRKLWECNNLLELEHLKQEIEKMPPNTRNVLMAVYNERLIDLENEYDNY